MGQAYFDKGQTGRAVASFEKAIELKSNYAEAHYRVYLNLGMALEESGRYDEAIKAFESFIRYTPTTGYEEEIAEARGLIEETRKKKQAPADAQYE